MSTCGTGAPRCRSSTPPRTTSSRRPSFGTRATLAWLGDLFVHLPSAAGDGRRRRIPFPVENGVHFGGMHHFDLLNHPAVYEQLKRWITRDPVRGAAQVA